MEQPTTPENEFERIRNLCALKILDTPPEERFDRITRLAAEFFHVPIALVSLVDVNRQWFKSKYGLDASETPRNVSFCGHAVYLGKTLVIENALLDPRFADNPLVTGENHIRFYAGCPVRSAEGYFLGTLCIIDREPRTFGEAQVAHLEDFAKLVEGELSKNRIATESILQARELITIAQRLSGHLAYSPLAVIEWDAHFHVTRWSSRAETMFGWKAEEVLGKTPEAWHFVHEDDFPTAAAVMAALSSQRENANISHVRNYTRDGRVLHCSWYNSVLLDEHGNIRSVMSLVQDDTARVEAEIGLMRSNEELEFRVQLRTQELIGQQAMLDAVLNTVDVGIVACDATGNLTLFNKATRVMHGLPKAEIPMERWADYYRLLAPDGQTPIGFEDVPLCRALAGEKVHNQELVIESQQGRKRIVSASGQQLLDESGNSLGAVVAMHDITEQKQYEAQLRANETLLRTITDIIPALVAYVDNERRYRYCNNQYMQVFGILPDELVGKSMEEFLGEESYAVVSPHVEKALGGETAAFERPLVANGVQRFVEGRFIPNRMPTGEVAGFYVVIWDITETKMRELAYKHQASIDPLTGIYNKKVITEMLKQEVEKHTKANKALAAMFLDIDHFKRVNDTHGHAIGDELIKLFVRRIKNAVRATDHIGRIGGDEFLVILPAIESVHTAEKIARKLLDNICQPCSINGLTLPLSTSIGIGYLSDPAMTYPKLLKAADEAVYEAKAAGRGNYKIRPGQAA